MPRKRPKSKTRSNQNKQRHSSTAPAFGQQAGTSALDVEYVNSRLALAGSACRQLLETVATQLDSARKLQLDLVSPIPGELTRLCDQLREMFGLKPGSAAPSFSAQPALDEFVIQSLALAKRIKELSAKLNELTVAEYIKLQDAEKINTPH